MSHVEQDWLKQSKSGNEFEMFTRRFERTHLFDSSDEVLQTRVIPFRLSAASSKLPFVFDEVESYQSFLSWIERSNDPSSAIAVAASLTRLVDSP